MAQHGAAAPPDEAEGFAASAQLAAAEGGSEQASSGPGQGWLRYVAAAGRCWEFIHRIDVTPPVPLVDEVLVAFGQVIFCESRITGLAYVAALLVSDYWLGVAALVATLAATLTAHAAGLVDRLFIKRGLTAYNAVLVGGSFATFLNLAPWSFKAFLAIAIAGSLSSFVSLAIDTSLGGRAWTYAFNFTALLTFMYTKPIGSAAAPTPWSEFEAFDAVDGILCGVAETIFGRTWVSGLIVLLGTAWASRRAAGGALLGSAIGFLVAFCVEADLAAAKFGLWGFNPALTGAAVTMLFPMGSRALVMLLWGAVGTQLMAAGLASALASAFQIPACTLPFSIAGSLLAVLLDRSEASMSDRRTIQRGRKTCNPEVDLEFAGEKVEMEKDPNVTRISV